MTQHSTSVDHLNTVIEQMFRKWMAIVELSTRFDFCFAIDDRTYEYDRIERYKIDVLILPTFGDVTISNEGSIKIHRDIKPIDSYAVVTAPIRLQLPKPLHDIFQKHCSSDMLDAELDHIGFTAVLHVDEISQFTVWASLLRLMEQLRLDAFTETLLRPNAAALAAELEPFLPWFDYAAVFAKEMADNEHRLDLIADMNLLLCYLSQGGQLNFAKMTSLCDVAGTLQPVRNLILAKMPQLAA